MYVYCNRWVLWYYKSDKSRDWMDNLKQIVSFDTVSYSEYSGRLSCLPRSHRLKISGGKCDSVLVCVIGDDDLVVEYSITFEFPLRYRLDVTICFSRCGGV